MNDQIHNINVIAKEKLPPPSVLKAILPLTDAARETVLSSRKDLMSILDRKDKRLIVVVGPCSIHDVEAAKDYANRLKELSIKTLIIILMNQAVLLQLLYTDQIILLK